MSNESLAPPTWRASWLTPVRWAIVQQFGGQGIGILVYFALAALLMPAGVGLVGWPTPGSGS